MTTAPPTPSEPSSVQPFELRASVFTLTVMELCSTDFERVDRFLQTKMNQAPAFFQNTPLIIDLAKVNAPEIEIDFVALYDLIRERGMIPVAIRNGNEEQVAAANAANIPSLPERGSVDAATGEADSSADQQSKADSSSTDVDTEPDKGTSQDKNEHGSGPSDSQPPPYRIYDLPVRSGQKVYARGDLVLVGPVSAGAEVVADGNIHAYAPLRGRALAGANGDKNARIFCHQLEAELVAIAGNYRVVEESDDDIWKESVQVYLDDDERLFISKISR